MVWWWKENITYMVLNTKAIWKITSGELLTKPANEKKKYFI
jgi:hypothetical protein